MPPPPSPQQQHQQHQQQQQQQQQLGGGPPSGRPQRKAGAQHSPAPSPAPTRASRSSRSSTSSSGSGSSPPLTATSPQTASSPPPLSTPQLKLDPAAKRAGKKKIAIEFIDDKSKRNITFSKRKRGIMKKVRAVGGRGLDLVSCGTRPTAQWCGRDVLDRAPCVCVCVWLRAVVHPTLCGTPSFRLGGYRSS